MTDAQLTERRKWIGLALLASTQIVIVLDAAIVNVAIRRSVATSSSRRRASPGSRTPTR